MKSTKSYRVQLAAIQRAAAVLRQAAERKEQAARTARLMAGKTVPQYTMKPTLGGYQTAVPK